MQPIIPAPIKPVIPFDLLEKIDFRIDTIESVEDVPEPKRNRGRQAQFVVNLATGK